MLRRDWSTAFARQILGAQKPGTHGIVDVVVDVGDEIGHAHDLPLERRGSL